MPDQSSNETVDWQAHSLRLTSFRFGSWPDEALRPWEKIVGRPPDEKVERPRDGSVLETGDLEGGRLTWKIDPTRADWFFIAETEPEEEAISSLGAFPDVLKGFSELMQCWLEDSPLVQRLAFGAILIKPADDRTAGYRMLEDYLAAVEIDPETSSDFLYQINRRRASKLGIDGLQINRLSKWSVIRFTSLVAMIAGGERPSIETMQTTAPLSACRLELDISTMPEWKGELPHDGLPEVFHELVTLGQEIAEKGDIP